MEKNIVDFAIDVFYCEFRISRANMCNNPSVSFFPLFRKKSKAIFSWEFDPLTYTYDFFFSDFPSIFLRFSSGFVYYCGTYQYSTSTRTHHPHTSDAITVGAGCALLVPPRSRGCVLFSSLFLAQLFAEFQAISASRGSCIFLFICIAFLLL